MSLALYPSRVRSNEVLGGTYVEVIASVYFLEYLRQPKTTMGGMAAKTIDVANPARPRTGFEATYTAGMPKSAARPQITHMMLRSTAARMSVPYITSGINIRSTRAT